MEPVKLHVILLASPGLGHLIPFLELSQRLASNHGVKVTIFAVAVDASPVQSKLHQLSCNKNDLLHAEVIQPENINSKLPPGDDITPKIVLAMQESLQLIRSKILAMDIRPTCLIIDFFGTEYYNIADELGMSKYVFMTVSAWASAFFIYLSVLKKEVSVDEVVSSGFVPIPGCAPVYISDMIEECIPTSPVFDKVAYNGALLAEADGIIVNSWEALEPSTLKAFRDPSLLGSLVKGAVYPVGPVVREANLSQLNGQVLHWLNEQCDGSVLFISFGSGGALTYGQIQELALGLEESKHKFLWVLRPPTDNNASEFYFNAEDTKGRDDPAAWLPDGFLTRTEEYGLVVSTWAPQMEILSHPSIGGFLSHCGWNSVLESIVNGVPMITWPLYAEQRMNAAMVSGQLKIGASPNKWPEQEIIGRDEVKKMVQMIMDDTDGENSFRLKTKEFKQSAAKALETSGSGSSHNAMVEFVKVLHGTM